MESLVNLAMHHMSEQKAINKALKQKALSEYEAALKMPRKKKKKAKNSAMILYSIACWGEDLLEY